MKSRTSIAALLIAVLTIVAASAVLSANAQPASEEPAPHPGHEELEPSVVAVMENIPTPPTTGDDKQACDRATQAQAQYNEGRINAQERNRALDNAKARAATAAMRRAIEIGVLPACPPDVTDRPGGQS